VLNPKKSKRFELKLNKLKLERDKLHGNDEIKPIKNSSFSVIQQDTSKNQLKHKRKVKETSQ
jgi:hypothetical protein